MHGEFAVNSSFAHGWFFWLWAGNRAQPVDADESLTRF